MHADTKWEDVWFEWNSFLKQGSNILSYSCAWSQTTQQTMEGKVKNNGIKSGQSGKNTGIEA